MSHEISDKTRAGRDGTQAGIQSGWMLRLSVPGSSDNSNWTFDNKLYLTENEP